MQCLMDFKKFVDTIKVNFPPYIKTTKSLDIYKYTEHLLNEYIELLTIVDDNEYNSIFTTKEEVIENISRQKSRILSAIGAFHNGDIVDCYEIIFKDYFYEDIDVFKVIAYKVIPARGPLFRLRVNKINRPFLQSDMFHIPYNKVHLINNQRFSLSGYPCLYLGTSAYCCWEELNRPDMERCNFSVFRSERDLNMVDLTPPQEIKSVQDLLRLPLILSCAIKITSEEAAFKPEYIISQAVLQCVVRLNNKKLSNIYLDGILYLSTKIGERIFYKDTDAMHNFVLPTVNRENGDFCSALTNMFSVSDAVTYQELWLKYPQLFSSFEEDASLTIDNYDISIFRKIEKFVMGKTVYKSKIS